MLREELSLSPQEFNRKFRESPVKRAGRRGYLRNVVIALRNAGDPEDIPALIQALEDSEPLIRSQAAWALGKISGKKEA
jgi:epoxyqueuosine reductase